MQRNKAIYGLADAALVVEATIDRGGTWAGAVEQLKKYPTPVYVRSAGEPSTGLDALQLRGARQWPQRDDVEGVDLVFNGQSGADIGLAAQPGLFDG